MRDFLSLRNLEPKDLLQYGVLGMKWGRRRTDAQIKADVVNRASSGEKVTPTKKAEAALKNTDGTETAAGRYARLSAEAKGGGAKSWSETDLKFYNSRTEALAKVDKMFEQNPGWLSTTSRKVLQTAAQRTMQDVANGVANKYITSKLLDTINDSAEAKTKK